MTTKHGNNGWNFFRCSHCSQLQSIKRCYLLTAQDLQTNEAFWETIFKKCVFDGASLPMSVRDIWESVLMVPAIVAPSLICQGCSSEYHFDKKLSKTRLSYWIKAGEILKDAQIFGKLSLGKKPGIINVEVLDLSSAKLAFYAALTALGTVDEELEEKIVLEMNVSDWVRRAYRWYE